MLAVAEAATVGRLRPDEVPAAAALIARAFDDDPFNRRVFPDAAGRRRIFELNARLQLEAAAPFGHVFAVRDGAVLQGVAVWLPPSASPQRVGPAVRALPALVPLAPVLVTAGPRLWWSLTRSGPAGPRLLLGRQRAARAVRRDPVWYLAILATDPELQGRGVGRRLLEHMLDRLDADGLGAWLETTDPSNVGLYERFAFATVAELDGGAHLPSLWVMRREPQGLAGPDAAGA